MVTPSRTPPSPSLRFADAATITAASLKARGLLLWRAGQMAECTALTSSSGWPALDTELPGGGWPRSGLFELLAEPASGELSLLAPWLLASSRRSAGSCELVWVAPPALPCVAALEQLGLPLPRLVCVEPSSCSDAAWAAEQALRAASCAAVMWWTDGPVTLPTLRRLHLAAQAGGTPLVAVRPLAARSISSPAPLRVACRAEARRGFRIDVFKRRGPPMADSLSLTLSWPASAWHAAPMPRTAAAPIRPVEAWAKRASRQV